MTDEVTAYVDAITNVARAVRSTAEVIFVSPNISDKAAARMSIISDGCSFHIVAPNLRFSANHDLRSYKQKLVGSK